jgi:hypothetical protein
MNKSVTVDLITITNSVNDLGDNIKSKAYSTVFAQLGSIRQSEYYQANANGLKPQFMFTLRSIDYGGEKSLRYSSTEYEVIRIYDKGEHTELICQGLTNGIT